MLFKKILIFNVLIWCAVTATGQRTYKTHSVLSTGNWHKIAVTGAGVYKMDVSFLAALGLGGALPSGGVRVFGRAGGMLPEALNQPWTDDLEEVALQVVDGGDGVLNGTDYVLFYSAGPHQWQADSVSRRFSHRQHLYTDHTFYYVSIGGTGKRIAAGGLTGTGTLVTAFDERYYHELDSVNFLSSGKDWYGEEFANAPGRTLSRSFALPFSDVLPGPVTVVTQVVARSVGAGSRFDFRLNNVPVQQVAVPPISGGQYDVFAQRAGGAAVAENSLGSLALTVQYVPGSFNAQGWLDWIEVFCRRPLAFSAQPQLPFRDWSSLGSGAATFEIGNAPPSTEVWDVTDPLAPVRMKGTWAANRFSFTQDATRLREYTAFSGTFSIPLPVGTVPNQDLHATSETDYLIITPPAFAGQAERLARFHQQKSNLRTKVMTTDQVFNEFAAGVPDPAALRDCIKLYYDRYRSTWAQAPRYVLLFGKGSFDYKNRLKNNTSLVPAYESAVSLDPVSSYTSDDFYGFLDDGENINSNLVINQLDAGIGRIPARNVDEAKTFVDKVEAYHGAAAFGPWRNQLNFIADDEDVNLHLHDAEAITATAAATAPVFNIDKIYLDAYRQEGGSAGGRYPQVNEVVNNNIYNGTLIWNYNGHGGPTRLAEEVVIDQAIVNGWRNEHRLPLFITGTCDFAAFDNPLVHALGEDLLVRPKTGAIALMTTTRLVFANSNRILNNNYLQTALERDGTGRYRSLGEANRVAKNYTYQTSADVVNNRKFTLLGDPAMTLGFPALQVKAVRINGQTVAAKADTLSATEMVTVEGEVTDLAGTVDGNFNGTVHMSLLDKPQQRSTLGNDPGSPAATFQAQASVLFKGKASAVGGRFSFRFRLPKDMNYQYGRGKLSLYAENGQADGNGYSDSVVIGGIESGGTADGEGPVIKAYLNDEQFVNGGLTNRAPVLLVKLADSSGINSAGTGIGHDIVATLDNDNQAYHVLNNFYESDLDNYRNGTIRFQLPELAPGPHTLKIKAWDVVNNSGEYELAFTVTHTGELEIGHVLNYPNPFTTRTAFWFEHNQPFTDLQVKVEIYTLSGKLIKTLAQTINTPGNRSTEVEWDGRDAYGSKIGRGVYIYRLQISNGSGKKISKWERLVLLN